MSAQSSIETATAEFHGGALYEDLGTPTPVRLTQGALLSPLSAAFDLSEGRQPGHAQRVTYLGIQIAKALKLTDSQIESVFFGCILHDAGMASATANPGNPHPRRDEASSPADWADVLRVLTFHSDAGARIVREMGLPDDVAEAVANHHECWETTGTQMCLTSRIVSVADRVESLIDADASPLKTRMRGPKQVMDMAGAEIDPQIAKTMAELLGDDEFWLGFHDRDLSASLMSSGYGTLMEQEQLINVLGVVSDVVDERNGRPQGSGRRISKLARKVALTCDLTERRADVVMAAALLQDIGTLGIPASYLRKPDILTVDEMEAVKLHSGHARDILSEIPGFGAASWWVGCHHERVDGRGYPSMLEGDDVPVEAQIIGMSEMYEALTNDRPFRKALTSPESLEIMQGLSEKRFSSHLLDRFEAVVGG